jgi:dTDP-4-amino-4,6-dideoxygalactose transaminase
MIKFFDLTAQYKSIQEEIESSVVGVLRSGNYVLGEQGRLFEKEFASFCGTKYAVTVQSGTAALHVALLAAGVKPGDEVLTATNSFIATAEAISHAGAIPAFGDVDKDTYNFNIESVRKAITSKTKAAIPVHLYGQPADMKEIKEFCDRKELIVIEDAAQTHGASHYKKRIPYGDIGCFSFYPGKNIGACGEGGIIVTNIKDVAEKAEMYRNHGQKEKNRHEVVGYNYRLDEIQCAILRIKLRHLEKWIERRRSIAKLYDELLAPMGNGQLHIPIEKKYNKHVYHLYVVRTSKREKLQQYLHAKGIQTAIHYPTPIHLQEAYRYLGIKAGAFPIAEQCAKEILSLPMYPEMEDEDILTVANEVREFFRQ